MQSLINMSRVDILVAFMSIYISVRQRKIRDKSCMDKQKRKKREIMCLHIFVNIFLDFITYRIKISYDVHSYMSVETFCFFNLFFLGMQYIYMYIYVQLTF